MQKGANMGYSNDEPVIQLAAKNIRKSTLRNIIPHKGMHEEQVFNNEPEWYRMRVEPEPFSAYRIYTSTV